MLKRWLKRIFLAIGVLLVVFAVFIALLYSQLIHTVNVKDYPTYNDLPVGEWAKVDLSDETQCSDGSDYRIYTRRGESPNLLVHFVGGGACWDAETCSRPISVSSADGFYFPYIWEILRGILDGIFKRDNPNNPFRDWTVVYIPYCTADFHIGASTNTYTTDDGKSVTIHYNGRQNVTEALDWVYATFASPEKLVISGESAGAFGSTFWTPTIAAHYPNSDIYQIADGAYLESPLWKQIVDPIWKADWEQNFGFSMGDDLIGSTYQYYGQLALPNVTYLHINTLYDTVLIYFSTKLNGVTDIAAYRDVWSAGMRASMAANAAANPNYYSYITDFNQDKETGTTPHTSVSFELFYQIEQDGVHLYDWLRRIVIEGERFSVGSEFLQPAT